MKLSEIAWPVYKLGDAKPQEEDGVVFIIRDNKLELIDDRNLPANSLAGRRLKLFVDGVKLFKLKYALFFLGDLIKISKSKTWFIDSKGVMFQYHKRIFAKLVFKKITKVIPSIACSLIEVEGLQARFKVLYPPDATQKYAGLLFFNKSYIIYGFYDKAYEETVRKI